MGTRDKIHLVDVVTVLRARWKSGPQALESRHWLSEGWILGRSGQQQHVGVKSLEAESHSVGRRETNTSLNDYSQIRNGTPRIKSQKLMLALVVSLAQCSGYRKKTSLENLASLGERWNVIKITVGSEWRHFLLQHSTAVKISRLVPMERGC